MSVLLCYMVHELNMYYLCLWWLLLTVLASLAVLQQTRQRHACVLALTIIKQTGHLCLLTARHSRVYQA